MLRLKVFQSYLKLPSFRGKSRLEAALRRCLFPEQLVRFPNGLRMIIDPREWAQRDLLAFGGAEPLTTRLLAKLLRSGDVYVDVGCHVGYHTLVARTALGETGRVIAIDPQPYNCERTLSNWRANQFSNLIVYAAAAGDSENSVKLIHQPATDRSRLSLVEHRSGHPELQFSVPVYTLQTILDAENVERIRVLKIDVEGYELPVLNGLGTAIGRVENVVLELLPEQRVAEGDAERISSLLDEAGFGLYTIEGKAWKLPEPLPENNLWASHRGETST